MPTRPLKYYASRLAPRLVIQNGPYQGEEFLIRKSSTLLGRSETCDLTLDDQLVSRRHCHILWDGIYSTLEDLRSTNGTFINDQRLTGSCLLHSGDVIKIAGTTLVFYDPQATLVCHQWPKLTIEPATKRVAVDEQPVELSAKEYTLLIYLYQNSERVCSKEDIAEAVWPDYQGDVFDYQVESLIKRLRKKLEPGADESHFVITIHGKGYRLVKP